MRLLNSTTFELQEFFEIDRPQFAILPHTWEKDEVSYQEMLAPTAATKSKDGFLKIQAFASIARSHGCHWVWVDTCCIDKTSSAELSEAINSMYRWYGDAAVCYVYLSDYKTEYPELLPTCRWFTRGWTLQELIAPRNVRFYSHLWEFVFAKSEKFWNYIQ